MTFLVVSKAEKSYTVSSCEIFLKVIFIRCFMTKSRFILGPIILVGALVALVTTGMKSNTMRAIPVNELRDADAKPTSFVSQRLRVVGFIGKEPLRKTTLQTAGGTVHVAHFQIEEKGKTLKVEFRDALPDTFRAGGPVQVDGVYVADGVMKADHVLTKCPSKYEQGEGEAAATSDKKYDATKAYDRDKSYGAKDVAANVNATARS